jgi:hypothetical protein
MTMNDSTFNPDALLDLSTESQLSTREKVLPEGDYEGTIKSMKGRVTTSEKGTFNWLDFQIEIDGNQQAPNGQLVSEIVNRPSTQVRYSITLDLTEAGTLASEEGRNLSLGRLREAADQNHAGPWSIRNLVGARLRVSVKHRFDKNDPSIIYQDISKVRKLG